MKNLLKLYITKNNINCIDAVENLKIYLKESGLEEKFKLEIIDILEHPELAEEEKVIAIPQLVQKSSLPSFRIIGNLSDKKKILRSLGVDNTVEG